jgi:hypothetical protein
MIKENPNYELQQPQKKRRKERKEEKSLSLSGSDLLILKLGLTVMLM